MEPKIELIVGHADDYVAPDVERLGTAAELTAGSVFNAVEPTDATSANLPG